LSVWTSLGLHCKVGHCIRVVYILTNILVVSSYFFWATTPYVDLENTGEMLPKFSLNTQNTYISPTIQCNSERDRNHHPKSKTIILNADKDTDMTK